LHHHRRRPRWRQERGTGDIALAALYDPDGDVRLGVEEAQPQVYDPGRGATPAVRWGRE